MVLGSMQLDLIKKDEQIRMLTEALEKEKAGRAEEVEPVSNEE